MSLLFREGGEEVMELIDTLWNVNQITDQDNSLEAVELIDTLWNVNVKLLVLLYVSTQN